jgi:hypothetical protein
MKAILKYAIPALVISGGALGLAFNSQSSNEPVRYEIIHTENGQTTNYDTIVQDGSSYTIENYISDLGLENNEHLEIIRIDDMLENMETFVMGSNIDDIDIDVEKIISGNCKDKHVIVKHVEESTTSSSEGTEDVQIKEIKIESDEELNPEEIRSQLEEQGLGEEMINQILSQITSGVEATTNDENVIIDNHVEMKMVFSDDSTHEFTELSDFEDLEENIIYEKDEPNRQIKVAMIGSANSTIAIVSKVGNDVKKKSISTTPSIEMEFYPNPAQDYFTLSFANDKEVKTEISIHNLEGKEVFSKKLGKIPQVNERIETMDWTSGVYLINIKTGKTTTTKKLIIK